MRTNGNTDMQPSGAALMRGMNIEDQALAVEAALRRTTKNMVLLVEDSYSRVCVRNGQLLRHRPKAGRSWKITPLQLVRIAPAKNILKILGDDN